MVAATHLKLATLVGVEVVEVVALQELVGKLREGESVAGFAVQTFLHTILGHHVVDSNVLTHITSKSQECKIFHPIIIINQFSTIGSITLEIKEVGQLSLDAGNIVSQSGFVQQVALLAFAAWITNHASSTSDERQGLVATALQMTKHHDTAEMTNMEAIRRGVYPNVSRDLFFLEEFLRARHHLVHHAAPSKFFNEVHRCNLQFYDSHLINCGHKGTTFI